MYIVHTWWGVFLIYKDLLLASVQESGLEQFLICMSVCLYVYVFLSVCLCRAVSLSVPPLHLETYPASLSVHASLLRLWGNLSLNWKRNWRTSARWNWSTFLNQVVEHKEQNLFFLLLFHTIRADWTEWMHSTVLFSYKRYKHWVISEIHLSLSSILHPHPPFFLFLTPSLQRRKSML